MATTVNDIYLAVCDTILEPGGVSLGILSLDDFLSLYSDTLSEWCQQTGLTKHFFALQSQSGQSDYVFPGEALDFQQVYYNGKPLKLDPSLNLEFLVTGWQNRTGTPTSWHVDRVDPKTVSLYPSPTVTGTSMYTGSGFYGTLGAPDASPNPGGTAFYGTIAGTTDSDTLASTNAFYGTLANISTSTANILLLATVEPPKDTPELTDTVDCVPATFMQYLVYGVLARVYSQDGELKSVTQQRYCQARWTEGLNLAKSIAQETQD